MCSLAPTSTTSATTRQATGEAALLRWLPAARPHGSGGSDLAAGKVVQRPDGWRGGCGGRGRTKVDKLGKLEWARSLCGESAAFR